MCFYLGKFGQAVLWPTTEQPRKKNNVTACIQAIEQDIQQAVPCDT